MTRDERLDGNVVRPRPSWWRYLRATIECVDAGLPPSTTNLAKELGISRVAVWKLQRRWPSLDRWCGDVLRQAHAEYWGHIERRMAFIAMQGSSEHARTYTAMRAAAASLGLNAGPPDVRVNQNGPTLNILCAQPQWPVAPLPDAAPPQGLVTVKAVPVLPVR